MINRDPARGKADLSDVSKGAKSSEDSLKVKEEVLVALWKHNSLSFAVCNLNGDIKWESLGDGSRLGGVLIHLRYLWESSILS